MSIVAQYQNTKVSHLSSLEFTPDKIQLLKDTICKNSNDNELQLFLHACKRSGLDPFMKQIYAVKRQEKQKDGTYKQVMTIQTGIDGYRLIAERTGRYAPGKETTFTYDSEGKLFSAVAYVKKQTTDGTWHEVSAQALWEEYVQTHYNQKAQKIEVAPFWKKMGHTMLAKCAEALALRKAFPGEYSGIYTAEEMAQADNPVVDSEPVAADSPMVNSESVTENLKTQNEIREEYLNVWEKKRNVNRNMFKEFMDEMIEARKWSFSSCIEAFEKRPEYTKEQFDNWLKMK